MSDEDRECPYCGGDIAAPPRRGCAIPERHQPIKIGELFAGYGGLGMGVKAAMGGEVAWVSDVDKGANKVLAHRFPGVPNLGDITTVDWSTVEPVDVLTGGTPCQDLSHAGKRAGMTEGTRSNLWVAMREAIAQLRPPLVVWENVRGAYSACADSEMGRCPRCVDPDSTAGHAPYLRALGRVLGDLSDLGYDASWHGLRAADVGAPHGRFRVFVVATDAERGGWRWGPTLVPRIPEDVARGSATPLLPTPVADNSRGLPSSGTDYASLPNVVAAMLPTPTSRDHKGRNQRDDESCLTGALLPTPRAGDGEKGGPNQRGSSGDLMLPSAVQLLPTPLNSDAGPRGGTTGYGLRDWSRQLIEEQRLLPTPRTQNNENRQSAGYGGKDGNFHGLVTGQSSWGQYADAITRWETLTRPAPPPTETGPKGNPRLNPAFSEWMMGLPAGWITDVPGVTRNEALKLAGNGVCPQQCEAALRFLLPLAVAA